MKERGMLFSKPMVLALLDGSKTQTRRIVKHEIRGPNYLGHFNWYDKNGWQGAHGGDTPFGKTSAALLCPYGQPGDRIWVRETGWERPERSPKMLREGADTWERYYYDADGWTDLEHDQFKEWGFKRRPCIHIPRWASRIDLEITGVRVERLNDISEADAAAEGIAPNWIGNDRTGWNPEEHGYLPHDADDEGNVPGVDIYDDCWTAKRCYQRLWEALNGAGSWDANPWVWVIEFNRVKP